MVINMLDYFPCRRRSWLNLLGTRDRRRRGASSARINTFILKQQLPAWHTAAARNRNENLVLKIFLKLWQALTLPQFSVLVQPLRGRQPKGLSSTQEGGQRWSGVWGDEPRPARPAIINADWRLFCNFVIETEVVRMRRCLCFILCSILCFFDIISAAFFCLCFLCCCCCRRCSRNHLFVILWSFHCPANRKRFFF